MKTNLIRKVKWCIVGFIMVVIMLSVGLSFCVWDNLSIQALKVKANTGGFDTMYKLVDDKYSDDNFTGGQNAIANVGDIVTFGRYWQDSPIDNSGELILPEKTSLRWIVVHRENKNITLLAESVVAFGSFWGTYCHTSSDGSFQGAWVASNSQRETYCQNYEQSTVRAWLNSNYKLRNDGGTAFSENERGVFRGFLNEAFNVNERAHIQTKTISGMRGSKKAAGNHGVDYYEDYKETTDKVWLPSRSELYGSDNIDWVGKSDGTPKEQFAYFKDNVNTKRISKATAFALSSASNYTYKGKTALSDNWQNVALGNSVWWWMRSPRPLTWHGVLQVMRTGEYSPTRSDMSYGGVRPAICIPL